MHNFLLSFVCRLDPLSALKCLWMLYLEPLQLLEMALIQLH